MMAVRAQWQAIRALILRDIFMRFGRHNIGFVWVIVEPLLLCTVVSTFWALTRPPYYHGMEIVSFITTGYMSLSLYRHISNSCNNLLKSNQYILIHRQLSMIDVLVSRCMLEFAGGTLAFVVVYGFLVIFRINDGLYDPRLVLFGWLSLAWFATGVGAVIATITSLFHGAHHFVQPLQYITIPLSPIFYMVNWMPANMQDFLYYNPLSHPYEMIRAGFFGPDVNPVYHPEVTFIWGLVFLSIGIVGVQLVKDRLHEL